MLSNNAFAVVSLLVLAAAPVASAAGPSIPNHWTSLDTEDLGVRSWSAEDVERVEIVVPRGLVRLADGAPDAVAVVVGEIVGPRTCSVHIALEDGVLKVETPSDRSLGTSRCAPELTLGVPSTIPVSILAKGARVELHEVASDLVITGQPSRVLGTYPGEHLEVTLASGNIKLSGLVTPPVTTTAQGRVRLRFDENTTSVSGGFEPEHTNPAIRTTR